MTDAVAKKANNANIMPGTRQAHKSTGTRTTHPSYTEYSWSSLTGRNQSINQKSNANTQPKRMSTVAAPAADRRSSGTAANTARVRAGSVGAHTAQVRGGTPKPKMMTGTAARPVNSNKPAGVNPTAVKTQKRAKDKPVDITKVKQKAAVIRKKSITTLHTIVIQKRYAFPLSIMLIAVAVTTLILAVITASVRINEITTENSELQRKYASLLSEENDLRTQLETRDDLRVVEEMAKNELGMVKKDQVPKYYLTINKQDKIELIEEETEVKQGFFDELLSLGASIADRIRAFFGM